MSEKDIKAAVSQLNLDEHESADHKAATKYLVGTIITDLHRIADALDIIADAQRREHRK